MPPMQLKETDPRLANFCACACQYGCDGVLAEEDGEERRRTADMVETLMGRKPELRFQFIQDNARFVEDIDI